jgi:carnitine 3-dehydrogenase
MSALPTKAAILGAGVIGSGWLARLIDSGVDCAVFDPAPNAEAKIAPVLDNAERAAAALIDAPRPAKGAWSMVGSIAEAVTGADLIVEAVPERLDIKHAAYREIEAVNADGLIASSTSGFKPSVLQEGMAHPERLIVAHPFNPVYLLPLVEIVGGSATDKAVIDRAMALYTELGMKPLHLKVEIDAFVADRLMEALWREALWLVKDGVATTEEIDDAIRYGCGLRWAQMGTFQTFHIAGGEAGMRHFMEQFGPALAWPWTKLMDVPEMTPELVDRIAEQSEAQAGGRTPRDLEKIRDDNLVAILKALRGTGWGAGQVLAEHEARLRGK